MSKSKKSKNLGLMPEWDLQDLYEGSESPKLETDLQYCLKAGKKFQKTYKNRVNRLSPQELNKAIQDYETFSTLMGKIGTFSQLYYAAQINDPQRGRFAQTIREKLTEITSYFMFFTLEINHMSKKEMGSLLKSKHLSHYKPWIDSIRAFRKHQLADDVERLLMERDTVGNGAWQRLYEETMAELRFSYDDQSLSSSEILNILSDPDSSKREKAARLFGEGLGKNSRLLTFIMNNIVKDKEIDDRWRGYKSPVSYRNLSNQVEDEVVEALVLSVQKTYQTLSHRYYALKAQWFGVEKLKSWDRNAPLPQQEDRFIPWPEAQEIVLKSYHDFSPALAEIGKKFFEKGWIDAPARPGKASGAFAHPSVPTVHPYILLNYHGKTRDVMTLAHELGHGIHQVLAAKQGYFLSNTPLTLAETASVFGEMLVFRSLLEQEKDPLKQKHLLASKVEDMLNTVVRQIAFYSFEKELHLARREGELSSEQIQDIWMKTQSESLGPALDFEESYRHYWSYISHFIQSPFYVYAYAFGDCLVNSLYDLYQKGSPDFQEKYYHLLESGGSLSHKEILKPFGIEISDPAFWDRGLSIISGFIDRLVSLSKPAQGTK
jgi:oligoendopeptidase F